MIKGKADATPASIYANAYNQVGVQSIALYSFLKSMENLRKFWWKKHISFQRIAIVYHNLKKDD